MSLNLGFLTLLSIYVQNNTLHPEEKKKEVIMGNLSESLRFSKFSSWMLKHTLSFSFLAYFVLDWQLAIGALCLDNSQSK